MMRRVYPGFVQLTAFMSMNPDRHKQSFRNIYDHLAAGRTEEAGVIQAFYEEYLAVNDLPAEFYLETMEKGFQTFDLARGSLTWRGRPVRPEAIRRIMLERHARYMPVMDKRMLMGVISFYDVAKAVVDSQNFENRMLKAYIRDWPASEDSQPTAQL